MPLLYHIPFHNAIGNLIFFQLFFNAVFCAVKSVFSVSVQTYPVSDAQKPVVYGAMDVLGYLLHIVSVCGMCSVSLV